MRKRKGGRSFETGMRIFLALFAAFCIALFWVDVLYASIGLLLVAAAFFVQYRVAELRRRDAVHYIDKLTFGGSAAQDSVSDAPFPMVICHADNGELVWANDLFYHISGAKRHKTELRLFDFLEEFDLTWLGEGKSRAPDEYRIGGRLYAVHGNVSAGSTAGEVLATLYFIDSTEAYRLRKTFHETRPVMGIVAIDNYEELMKNVSDIDRNRVLGEVDERLNRWIEGKDCLLRKYDRDKNLLIFEQRYLEQFVEKKFTILDEVKAIESNGIPVTLSIGIGREFEGFAEGFQYAMLAFDMSLSRGGDQAVIKHKTGFDFFGGKTWEMEKRTKVKSRVMASALSRLVGDSGRIFVMGHKISDLDCVGAAAGVVCAARKLGKRAHIVVDRERSAATLLIDKLAALPEYADVFLTPREAQALVDNRTLLVIVDVNRTDFVESPEVLAACSRVVVIDHHRRVANYIDRAALNLHEPYASSTSELVCELLGYIDSKVPMLKAEAEAMLAGIVLDTKNFSMRTGVRTFEAAAQLRQAGADTIEIKRLFQVDFEACVERYQVITHTHMYRGTIAVSMSDRPVDRTVAAQAADELLNLMGVQASFVLFPEGDLVVLSARSLGKVNVQVILEKLGGGGHLNMAGAQVKGQTPELVLSQLYQIIDDYLAAQS